MPKQDASVDERDDAVNYQRYGDDPEQESHKVSFRKDDDAQCVKVVQTVSGEEVHRDVQCVRVDR